AGLPEGAGRGERSFRGRLGRDVPAVGGGWTEVDDLLRTPPVGGGGRASCEGVVVFVRAEGVREPRTGEEDEEQRQPLRVPEQGQAEAGARRFAAKVNARHGDSSLFRDLPTNITGYFLTRMSITPW